MAKRQKTVFKNTDAVAHAWATQSQAVGYGPKINSSRFDCGYNRRIFFEGPSIYSYGKHFELARFVKDKNGADVVLFNSKSYSITTTSQKGSCRSAVSHLPSFHVSNLEDLEESAQKWAASIEKACLNRFCEIGMYHRYETEPLKYELADAEECNRFLDRFGLKEPKVVIPQELIDLVGEHFRYRRQRFTELNSPAEIAKRNAARERRKAAEQLKMEAAKKDAIAAWYAGNPYAGQKLRSLKTELIRVNSKAQIVETTGGAEVPLADAIKLYRAIKNGTAEPGQAIGMFRFTEYTAGKVRIGCHTINLSDADKVLGLNLKLKELSKSFTAIKNL